MTTLRINRTRFSIAQGEDFQQTIEVADENGLALDLNGWDGEAQIRAGFKDSNPTVLGNCAVTMLPDGWTDAMGNKGWVAVIQLSRAQTALLTTSNLPQGDGRVDGFLDNGIERKLFVMGAAVLQQVVTEDL